MKRYLNPKSLHGYFLRPVTFAAMHIGIAVWSSVLSEVNHWEYVEVLLASVAMLAPGHSVTLITNEAKLAIPANVKVLQVPLITSYFGLRRWHGKTLPALVQKNAIDALITINSSWVNTSVLQLPVFISLPAALKGCNTWLQFFYKKYLAKSLQKASVVGIVSSGQHHLMNNLLGVKEERLLTVGYAVSANYQPIDDWQQREIFLQNQTGGKEYFLYTNQFSEEGFLQVLKAFSLFKKRQKSNMQLLIPGQFTISKKLLEKMDTYKYRQDVQLLNLPNEDLLPQLVACAYAILFTSETTPTAWPVAAAMQCYTPVIGSENNTAAREAAGPAALYAQANSESLAEQMKQVYKDENLRQTLIFYAAQHAQKVNGRQAAHHILTYFSAV